jgi:hypothetical protein
MNILLVAIAATVAVGGAAGFIAYDAFDSEHPPADACRTWPLEGSGGSGLVRFEIDNEGPATRVTVCVISYDLEKVAVRNLTLPAYQRTIVDLDVPVGLHWIELQANGSHGGSNTNLWMCMHRAHRQPFSLIDAPDHTGGGVSGGGCFDPSSSESSSQQQSVLPTDDLNGPAGPAVGIGLGAGAATALLFLFRARLHLAGLLLFTRLARPKVLELDARQRIHELVTAEPGIHASAIAKRLELAQGESLYHLNVLVREKLLIRIGNWGQRSFFVAGRWAPRQMRAMAALRSAALDRLYLAVVANPGASLQRVARAAGYSIGRASRLSRRLEEVGLVQRRTAGRNVLLSPGAGFEAPGSLSRAS